MNQAPNALTDLAISLLQKLLLGVGAYFVGKGVIDQDAVTWLAGAAPVIVGAAWGSLDALSVVQGRRGCHEGWRKRGDGQGHVPVGGEVSLGARAVTLLRWAALVALAAVLPGVAAAIVLARP